MLFGLLALSFGGLSAQAGNVFEVQKIKVDASAASTSLARAAALREGQTKALSMVCLLYTSDAADEEDSVDLGGRRIIKKKTQPTPTRPPMSTLW